MFLHFNRFNIGNRIRCSSTSKIRVERDHYENDRVVLHVNHCDYIHSSCEIFSPCTGDIVKHVTVNLAVDIRHFESPLMLDLNGQTNYLLANGLSPTLRQSLHRINNKKSC